MSLRLDFGAFLLLIWKCLLCWKTQQLSRCDKATGWHNARTFQDTTISSHSTNAPRKLPKKFESMTLNKTTPIWSCSMNIETNFPSYFFFLKRPFCYYCLMDGWMAKWLRSVYSTKDHGEIDWRSIKHYSPDQDL